MKSIIIISFLTFTFSMGAHAQETQKQNPPHEPVVTMPIAGQQFTNSSRQEIEANSLAQIQANKQLSKQVEAKREVANVQLKKTNNSPQSTDEVPTSQARKSAVQEPVAGQPSSIDEVAPVQQPVSTPSKVQQGKSSIDD